MHCTVQGHVPHEVAVMRWLAATLVPRLLSSWVIKPSGDWFKVQCLVCVICKVKDVCVVSVASQNQEPRVFAHPTQGWSLGLGSLVAPRDDVAAWRVRVVVQNDDSDNQTCCCLLAQDWCRDQVLCAKFPAASQELPGEQMRVSADKFSCEG